MSSIAICHGDHGKDAEGNPVGPHCPLRLYAGFGDETAQAEQSKYGYEVMDIRYDGVHGLGPVALLDAEVDESPACIACMAEIHHWDHSDETAVHLVKE